MNRFLLSLLFLIFCHSGLLAAPMYAGGQITYTHKGNGVYDFFLSVVYDCSGDTVQSKSLTFYRLGTGYSGSFTVGNGIKYSEQDVTGYTDSCLGMSPCSGGTGPIGYKRVTYKFTHDLTKDSACSFRIYWSDQNYSSNITTGYANLLFELDAQLDRCSADHNSPEFISDFTPNLEQGKNAFLVYSCVANSDSLVYSLVYPTGKSNGIGQFTNTRPVTFLGFPNTNVQPPAGFWLDEYGFVQFRPTTAGQVGVICVLVEQWRKINGTMVKVGYVRRDMLVDIANRRSGNNWPEFSWPNNYWFCDNDTAIRVIRSEDDDSLHFTDIEIFRADSNFIMQVVDTGQHAYLTYRLKSGIQINNNIQAKILLLVKDNYCPFYSTYIKEFTFFIKPHVEGQAILSPDTNCGTVSYSIVNAANIQASQWTLTPQDTLQKAITLNGSDTKLLSGTWYSKVRMTNNTCSVYSYDTFEIHPYAIPDLSINTVNYCPGDSVFLRSGVDSSFSNITYHWKWSGNTHSDTLGYFNLPADSMKVLLQIIDANKCVNSDSLNLNLFELSNLHVALDTSICWEGQYPIFHPFDPNNQYTWWSGAQSDTTHVDSSGIYWLSMQDTNGCIVRDSFTIVLKNIPKVDLGIDKKICAPDSVLVSSGKSYAFYSWNNGSSDSSIWVNQSMKVVLRVGNSVGCYASDSLQVRQVFPTPLDLGPDAILCWKDSILLDASQGFAVWYWKDGYTGPTRWVRQQGNYELTALDGNGCASYDDFYLAKVRPEVTVIGDTSMCQGDSLLLKIGENHPFVVWSTGDTSQSVYVGYAGQTTVYIEDSTGCPNTAIFTTWVNPLPNATFYYSDLGQRNVQFSAAQSQLQYNWQFGDGDSASSQSPLHQFDSIKTYEVVLMVEDNLGCINSSSQSISFGTGTNPVSFHAINVYPNPNIGEFTIDWEGPAMELEVYDRLGRKVGELKLNTGLNAFNLDLPAGIYFLRNDFYFPQSIRLQVLKN